VSSPVTFSYDLRLAHEWEVEEARHDRAADGGDVKLWDAWQRSGEMVPAMMEICIGRTGEMENLYDDGWLVWVRRGCDLEAESDEQARGALEWLCEIARGYDDIVVGPEDVWPADAVVRIDGELRAVVAQRGG
jgi:hypothetical protein